MSRVIRVEPEDETLRRIVQLNGLWLDTNTAVRARLAELMALRSDPAATNMLLGVPYYPVAILLGGGPAQLSLIQQPSAQKQETAQAQTAVEQPQQR